MSRHGGMLGKVFTVGAFTALSRVLGLVREMMQSRLIGAGVEQSAFVLAFAIPNMARKLFGEGALTSAFVPVFKGEVEQEGLAKAAKLARAVMTMLLLLLGAATALALAGLLGAMAVGDYCERTRLTLKLVAILLPYMLAICGAAFGMGVVNALGLFKASSFMPVLLNLVWIAALAALAFIPGLTLEQRVEWVASAILLGGFLQMAFMFWRMHRAGVSPWLRFTGWREPKVRLVWKNLAIAAVGAGAVQVNYMLDQVLAQCAAPWAAGVVGYAERLMDLPLGVVAVAFGTVLLPTFAGLFAKGDLAGAREAFASSVRSMMFLMLPASAGLCVLAPEVTQVIYEGGSFDAWSTVRVSRALSIYATGLAFCGYLKCVVPWFHAQNDMRTPMRVTLVTVIANAVLNILAVKLLPIEWRHVGLAASTVLCAAAACVLLTVLAVRKNGETGLSSCVGYVMKTLVAALAMAAVVLSAKPMFVGFVPLAELAALIAIGALAYAALALPFGLFRGFRLRRRGRR